MALISSSNDYHGKRSMRIWRQVSSFSEISESRASRMIGKMSFRGNVFKPVNDILVHEFEQFFVD
ncbi:hypothetical protein K7432_008808 [Basidiobolus ranarum]|uniref:Uncharacterized protein n=1 Tax=Basidiobolus ranarum TaxID=34480 RepID=A0ABR2WRA1_9FUNG